jgi:hypothetical protein
MGFSRAEESGDPDTVRAGVFQVSFDELIQRPPHLAGDDELLDFQVEVAVVIGFDDSVNWAGYVL